MSFVFRLISKCFQDASGVEYGNAHFLIEENDWNDYDFYVMYHLHATPLTTGNRTMYLGYIKIMKSGQEKYDEYLLRKALGKQVEFGELPEGFVSLTQSIDVFDGLNNLLNAAEKKDFVKQMHLILSTQDDEYYSMVEGQEALINGLLLTSDHFL